MMRAAWIALVLTVCAWSYALPDTPGIKANQQPHSSAGIKTNPNRQPEIAPNPVTIIQSIQRPAEARPSADEGGNTGKAIEYWSILGFRFKITDLALALFTGLLVGVGAWQGFHLRRTVSSYISGGGPHIYPSVPEFHVMTVKGEPVPEVRVRFGNFGRTVAVIRAIRADLFIGDMLPLKPGYPFCPQKTGYVVTRGGEETVEYTFEYHERITGEVQRRVIKDLVNVYFYGYVIYTDIFERVHERGFCLRHFSTPIENWIPAGGTVYNYSRSKKIPKKYRG